MIYDFSSVIMQFAKLFTVKSNKPFIYEGVTYDGISTTGTVYGVMTSLEDEDIQNLTSLGYSITGSQTFFVPGTEALAILSENDIIVDDNGVEWVILPKDGKGQGIQNWLEHGNFIQYIVTRRIT